MPGFLWLLSETLRESTPGLFDFADLCTSLITFRFAPFLVLESGFKVDSSLRSNPHGGGSVGGHEGCRIIGTPMTVTGGHFVTWGAVVCARN